MLPVWRFLWPNGTTAQPRVGTTCLGVLVKFRPRCPFRISRANTPSVVRSGTSPLRLHVLYLCRYFFWCFPFFCVFFFGNFMFLFCSFLPCCLSCPRGEAAGGKVLLHPEHERHRGVCGGRGLHRGRRLCHRRRAHGQVSETTGREERRGEDEKGRRKRTLFPRSVSCFFCGVRDLTTPKRIALSSR